MLGWERIAAIDGETKDFYIRQLWDAKGSADIDYGVICGWTVARAHARSGDAVAIAAYLGTGDTFDRAMASFGETYADRNERDYGPCRRRLRAAALASRQASDLPGLPS